MWPFNSSKKDYVFDPRRYADTYLGTPRQESAATLEKASEVVYCFWTGDNDITPNRLEALDSMRKVVGVEVKLITPANLDEYVVTDHPIHPGYRYLSLNHRSDYLRCYFMHHHGGGYADVKRHSHSWKEAFEELDRSDKWGLGYQEVSAKGVPKNKGAIGRDTKKHWPLLIGNCSFVFRPRTPLTHEWNAEVERRMDGYLEALKRNPGDMWGKNKGYPIRWAGLQSSIFHPIVLKYHDKLLMNDNVKPSFENYR